MRVREERAGFPAGELVIDRLDGDVHEREVVRALVRTDVLGGDRVDVLLDVARELALGERPLVVGLGLDEPVVVVERELGVDRNVAIDAHDRVHPLAGVERVLDSVRAGGKPVAEEVLQQELAETAARLRRPQSLLQPGQVLRALKHLRRRLVDLSEPLVDLEGRLRRALESPVDLRVELGEAAVHRLDHAVETAVDLRIPLGELGRRLRLERGEEAREPHGARRREQQQEQGDEDQADHRADER